MDPCSFWKNFVDTSLPDPAVEASDAELNEMVNHLMACEICGKEAANLIGLLERMPEDPESPGPTEDMATFERASLLFLILMMNVDAPTAETRMVAPSDPACT